MVVVDVEVEVHSFVVVDEMVLVELLGVVVVSTVVVRFNVVTDEESV